MKCCVVSMGLNRSCCKMHKLLSGNEVFYYAILGGCLSFHGAQSIYSFLKMQELFLNKCFWGQN